MDLSAHRVAGAMRSAQVLYDLATPDYAEPWIETIEGDRWLEAGIAELLAKRDVKLAGKVIASARSFIAEFAQALAELDALDDEFDVEWDRANGRPYSSPKDQKLARQVAIEEAQDFIEAVPDGQGGFAVNLDNLRSQASDEPAPPPMPDAEDEPIDVDTSTGEVRNHQSSTEPAPAEAEHAARPAPAAKPQAPQQSADPGDLNLE